MAIAFYIPDQATLLRKAQQQEQQILRLRETQWRFLASIVLEALKQYVESGPNFLIRRNNSSSGSSFTAGSCHMAARKWRKPSQ